MQFWIILENLAFLTLYIKKVRVKWHINLSCQTMTYPIGTGDWAILILCTAHKNKQMGESKELRHRWRDLLNLEIFDNWISVVFLTDVENLNCDILRRDLQLSTGSHITNSPLLHSFTYITSHDSVFNWLPLCPLIVADGKNV